MQESGNRMTEQNLATMLGPNILHKESKVLAGAGGGGAFLRKWDFFFFPLCNEIWVGGWGGEEGGHPKKGEINSMV